MHARVELMQTPRNQRNISHRTLRRRESRLLLVACTEETEDETVAAIDGHLLRVVCKATSLLEGLGKLDSEGIQTVVLGSELSEEELALFLLDARRRGFRGTVLHVVAQPSQLSRINPLHGGTAAERRSPVDSKLSVGLPAHDISSRLSGSVSFTEKERAVLTRVSSGWTNLQIAQELKCSEGSVKAILQQLFGKLGVRKRAQIVRMAFETGFRAPTVKQRSSGAS
jgi:DNA-binding NarL/FixJ family response regulator